MKYLSHVFMRTVGGLWTVPCLTFLAGAGTVIALAAATVRGVDTGWRVARRYCFALAGVQLVFVLIAGGTGGFRPRFVIDALIPVVLLTAMGATVLCRRIPRWEPWLGAGLIVVIAIASVAGLLRYRDTVAALSDGVSDSALVGRGGLGLSPIWVALPSMASRAPPGSTIASSEIGLLGMKRTDLRIVDLRGLTDRVIARDAPRGSHGVRDQREGLVLADFHRRPRAHRGKAGADPHLRSGTDRPPHPGRSLPTGRGEEVSDSTRDAGFRAHRWAMRSRIGDVTVLQRRSRPATLT